MNESDSKSQTLHWWQKLKYGRTLSQLLFLGLTVWVGIQMAMGVRGATIERYCPFGGVETLLPWLNKTGTLCSLSTLNISLFLGVLVLTVLLKRVFCSHICPMGAVFEWLGILGLNLKIARLKIPPKVDFILKGIKYPILILIIYGTYKASELVFRDFDPFYVLFSGGQGHGIARYGIPITIALLAAAIVLPLSFCKYLCPFAATLAPFGRFGLTRIVRNEENCTQCKACDKACNWGVTISDKKVINSAECSNCLDCLRKCPVPGTMSLRIGGGRK